MFGQCPLHRFLLLRRIFRASPVKECAEFILFLFAALAAQWEKVKSVVLTFSAIYDFVRNPILHFTKLSEIISFSYKGGWICNPLFRKSEYVAAKLRQTFN